MNIAKALGGRRNGSNWMALCPAHDDTPSLSTAKPGDGRAPDQVAPITGDYTNDNEIDAHP